MRLRQATEGGLFTGSLVISLGLHAALAALVLFGGGFQKPAALPVLTVSLVAPDPGPPGSGAASAPAGVQTAKASPPSSPPAQSKKQVSPPLKVKKKPKKQPVTSRSRPQPENLLPPIPPRPALPPVVQAPTPPAPAARPPAPSPSPDMARGWSKGALGQTTGENQTNSSAGTSSSAVLGFGKEGKGGGGNAVQTQRNYLKLIRTRILAQRKYPHLARQRHQEGVVRLRFTLSAAGALSQGVQVVKPSGFQLLDTQAQQCVQAAAPFPPFPPDLQRESLTVVVPIVYKLTELGR
jgi:protein TonB